MKKLSIEKSFDEERKEEYFSLRDVTAKGCSICLSSSGSKSDLFDALMLELEEGQCSLQCHGTSNNRE